MATMLTRYESEWLFPQTMIALMAELGSVNK